MVGWNICESAGLRVLIEKRRSGDWKQNPFSWEDSCIALVGKASFLFFCPFVKGKRKVVDV